MSVASEAKRTALVTGANRGIGLEVCRQLAGLGYSVIMGVRDLERGRRAARTLADRTAPLLCHVCHLDVAAPDLEAQIASVLREAGPIGVLVNNAAIHYDTQQSATTADMTIVREAIETNLLGAWRLSAALAPAMRRRGFGRIVNVSSEAGSLAGMGSGTPAYSVSKAALNAMTLSFANELRGSGVLVNAVCPGWVATDMGGLGGRPVQEGAASVVWAVTLPDGGPTGGFFRDGERLPW